VPRGPANRGADARPSYVVSRWLFRSRLPPCVYHSSVAQHLEVVLNDLAVAAGQHQDFMGATIGALTAPQSRASAGLEERWRQETRGAFRADTSGGDLSLRLTFKSNDLEYGKAMRFVRTAKRRQCAQKNWNRRLLAS
jgi:hypothetical protein